MIKLKVFLCLLLILSSIGCIACANRESKEPAQKTESVAIYEDLSEFLNDEQIEIFKLAQHIYPQHISGITEHNYGWYILSLDEPECYYFSIYDDNEESYHKNDSLSFPYFNEEHITQAFGDGKAFRLFWNDAILEVEYYIEDGTRYFDICSVEYGGTRLDLSSHPISNFRYSVRGYETEQGFVFSSDEDISKTWIFTNEGIIEVATDNIGDMSIPGWYNLPVYQFYKRGDGSLGYTRRPHKALKSQDIVSQLQYIVAEDEIGMEKGFATVQNGELFFHPEHTYTISELYDLEKLFSDWLEYASSLSDEALESYGIFSKVKSLEELLQYNAAHYESISNGEVNNNTNTDYVGSETEITEKNSLVFSISQGLKNYGIILDSQYLTDDIQGEKSNYYEFVSLGDFPSINSIELKALYHCTEENIQTQSDYIILNYQSFATIFYCENFSYSNNNTLMTYAIQDNETSKYCFVCLLYDIENNMLCEFILEIGDIETFRVISSNNTVKEMFENIYITESPYSGNDEANDNTNTDYVGNEYVSTSIPDPDIVSLEFAKASQIDSELWNENHFNGCHTIYSENIIETIIDVYENNYGDNVVLASDDVSFECSKTQFNTEYNDYYVTGLHWNDTYKKFPIPLSLTPQGFSYAKCDDFVIVGGTLTNDYNYDSETKWYLITENELYEMNNIPSEDMVKYRFFEADGKVTYTKTNTDYIIAVQALEYMIDAYTNDEQFYAESGEVVLNNDGPKCVMEEYYTINDLYLSKDTFLGYDRKSMDAETVGEFYRLLLEKSEE